MIPTETPPSQESGFILFEVLISIGLIALAGTAILAICITTIGNADRQLDRSVALMQVESLAKQIMAHGPNELDLRAPPEDELFRYIVEKRDTPVSFGTMQKMVITAVPRAGDQRPLLSIEFLVRRTTLTGTR